MACAPTRLVRAAISGRDDDEEVGVIIRFPECLEELEAVEEEVQKVLPRSDGASPAGRAACARGAGVTVIRESSCLA